ncbi:C2 family cysteine protease [Cellulomonas marina]|uniref:Calpain family cysteine protease n=1 Tax=Cellulomonas marina TaxID=988821 RepID=A0A1I1ALD6_9CELL|nr:C2 family cysteine protease [Cellulomonas marina]GIG30177.1 hypothetical protein Cma02nite_27770 [Cellulomonas marina]SFB37298.1 Calpain family cysteine protease [Cellulomonas marina]
MTTTAPRRATAAAARRAASGDRARDRDRDRDRQDTGAAPFVTARNPYALTELVLGHPVDWAAVTDPLGLVEDTLLTPREQLFDPRWGSPVYLGFGLGERDEVVPVELPRGGKAVEPESEDAPRLPDEPRTLADLRAVLGDLDAVTLRAARPTRAGGWTVEVAPAGSPVSRLVDTVVDRSVLERLLRLVVLDTGWTPAGAEWRDTGRFFDEAAEFSDPVQGGLGDCWLIAAMSSVAWALPGRIADAARATGVPNDRFTHRFEYRDPGDGSQRVFEASDETLVWSGTTSPLYARSAEPGEIWPGVVEKAFAQWRQGTTHDHPDLTVLNGGDPVWASAALSGRTPQYTWHAGTTAAALRTLVKSHSRSYRTVDPMTAWTYGTAPDGLSYADATIVGNHAYSVLGWTTGTVLRRAFDRLLARSSSAARLAFEPQGAALLDLRLLTRDYVILRNPWGSTEATVGARHGAITVRDEGFWRSIDLDVVDGVFAIDFPTYQQYFAGTGVAV